MTSVAMEDDGLHVTLEVGEATQMSEMFPEPEELPAGPYSGSFPRTPVNDPVNHPSHYTHYQGLEIIDLTEQMNFNKGNAVKYIARAGLKNPDTEIQDLEKAVWYIQREIDRITNRP